MRGLENNSQGTYSRGKSACSFCRSTEHQATVCPHVQPIWKELQKLRIPLKYVQQVLSNTRSSGYSPLSYYTNPHNWGDLYKHTEKAATIQERYNARKKAKKKRGGKRATKCGFCGSSDHTRRTCQEQKDMIALLKKANRNYRQWFYNKYVAEQGLSDGALIKFRFMRNNSYNKQDGVDTHITTLCTGINWDSINLFSEFTPIAYKRWGLPESLECTADKLENMQMFLRSSTRLKISVQPIQKYVDEYYIRGQSMLSVPLNGGDLLSADGNSLGYYRTGKASEVEIVSRAPQVLSDTWVDEYSDEMSVIFKKFRQDRLEYVGALDHIREWAKKEQ